MQTLLLSYLTLQKTTFLFMGPLTILIIAVVHLVQYIFIRDLSYYFGSLNVFKVYL